MVVLKPCITCRWSNRPRNDGKSYKKIFNNYSMSGRWICGCKWPTRRLVPRELAITASYPTSANGIIVLLNFFKLQTSGYYNWIVVNYKIKRPDINVTSGKPRENHMTCAPFANFVEWKIWKGRTLCFNYSRQVLFSLSLAVTVKFVDG